MFLDFVVPWNGFLAAGLWVTPFVGYSKWNGCRLREPARSHVPEDGRATPGASCQEKFRRFRLGIEPESFLTPGFKQETNRFLKIAKTFFLGLTLSVSPGNFKTGGPKTAFIQFAAVNNGCESSHGFILLHFALKENWFYFQPDHVRGTVQFP